jgi:hypothetical protein
MMPGKSTDWVVAITSSRTSVRRSPVWSSWAPPRSICNLMAIKRESIARLPDGDTITLREMPTSL